MGHWVFKKELARLLPNSGRGDFTLSLRANWECSCCCPSRERN